MKEMKFVPSSGEKAVFFDQGKRGQVSNVLVGVGCKGKFMVLQLITIKLLFSKSDKLIVSMISRD